MPVPYEQGGNTACPIYCIRCGRDISHSTSYVHTPGGHMLGPYCTECTFVVARRERALKRLPKVPPDLKSGVERKSQ